MIKAIFLDRDGVINIEKNYLYKISDFEFIDDTLVFLKKAVNLGYSLIVVTNQAGIAKGKYSENDYLILNDWMLSTLKKKGIPILATYYSPFHKDGIIKKYATDHFTRKPNPGMLLQAQKDFDIDMSNSILIGDRFSDILAGYNAGVGKLYLIGADYNYRDFHYTDYPNVFYDVIQKASDIQLNDI